MEDLSRHQQLGRAGPKELNQRAGALALQPGLDQRVIVPEKRRWGSVASRYDCPVIVLVRRGSLSRT